MIIFVPHTEADYETANSYLNVEDADQIISKQRNNATWNGFDDETKEMLLIQSSLAVDGAMMYQGAKTSADQVLKFPRCELLTLPLQIKFATAFTALLYSNDKIFKNVKREKIGKHEKEYFEGLDVKVDASVLAYLEPLRATTVSIGTTNEY
jgi:hypothetical protein